MAAPDQEVVKGPQGMPKGNLSRTEELARVVRAPFKKKLDRLDQQEQEQEQATRTRKHRKPRKTR
jgi:hypothetical protein